MDSSLHHKECFTCKEHKHKFHYLGQHKCVKNCILCRVKQATSSAIMKSLGKYETLHQFESEVRRISKQTSDRWQQWVNDSYDLARSPPEYARSVEQGKFIHVILLKTNANEIVVNDYINQDVPSRALDAFDKPRRTTHKRASSDPSQEVPKRSLDALDKPKRNTRKHASSGPSRSESLLKATVRQRRAERRDARAMAQYTWDEISDSEDNESPQSVAKVTPNTTRSTPYQASATNSSNHVAIEKPPSRPTSSEWMEHLSKSEVSQDHFSSSVHTSAADDAITNNEIHDPASTTSAVHDTQAITTNVEAQLLQTVMPESMVVNSPVVVDAPASVIDHKPTLSEILVMAKKIEWIFSKLDTESCTMLDQIHRSANPTDFANLADQLTAKLHTREELTFEENQRRAAEIQRHTAAEKEWARAQFRHRQEDFDRSEFASKVRQEVRSALKTYSGEA